MENIIIVNNLSKTFGEKKILENLNLIIKENESIVIIGPSGCGKSVFIKCVCGLILPDYGSSIIINNKEVSNKYISERKDDGIAFIFQNNALFDSMTVKDNIIFSLKNSAKYILSKERQYHYQTESAINDFIKNKLLDVDLDPNIADLYPQELSGGMQKRVALARALALSPKIIFCDEPTSGLDPLTSYKIAELMKNVHSKGKTIVSISHDPIYTKIVSDKVFYINKKTINYCDLNQIDKINEDFISYFI
ncbi:ABC transporter ATP-binding protein [Lyticum sinuosum]|uniref:ABC transporter ATP-binding protein n=1 Tax=Lyticum sinuosum TaxID=1332059 RepID=A0AAE4VJK8_9RICK|nr:ATP-binding cassette domain-containing protein [Lyticum sinuosum]MDZ5761215.1 ABC transporter ATP-binding protein [Lyticum sinuosum]